MLPAPFVDPPLCQKNQPIIWISGPTASGKSALSMRLAQALAAEITVEIISVDSALIYQGMDIGTAKPSVHERAQVTHHLIDLLDPSEHYSAAQFCIDAKQHIKAIHARGHLPLLVGGTMLYFKALRDGLSQLPSAQPLIRQEIDAQAAQLGWPALHAKLSTIDPISAARLAPTDAQRIQRALEVYAITGRSLSDLIAAKPMSNSQQQAPALHLSLEPQDRSELHQRIAERFKHMLANGLIEEVAELKKRPDLHLGLPSMRCVGYRQVWQYLDGKMDQEELYEQGIAATRQLAKRQLTWSRSMSERQVLPINFSGQDILNLKNLMLKHLDFL